MTKFGLGSSFTYIEDYPSSKNRIKENSYTFRVPNTAIENYESNQYTLINKNFCQQRNGKALIATNTVDKYITNIIGTAAMVSEGHKNFEPVKLNLNGIKVFCNKLEIWASAVQKMRGVSCNFNHTSEKKEASILSKINNLRATRSEFLRKKKLDDFEKKNLEEKLQNNVNLTVEESKQSYFDNQTITKKSDVETFFDEIAAVSNPIIQSYKSIFSSQDQSLAVKALNTRIRINRRIGQIANSSKQIRDIVQDLLYIISQCKANADVEFENYVIHIICTKIIDQAETQICLHAPSAFPIARAVVDLGIYQKNLMPLLIYLMISRCPLIAPKFVHRQPGQSEISYRISIGYRVTAENKIESEYEYNEKISGIVCLYGAIVQTESTTGLKTSHGLDYGWNWLARILNMKPEPITPFILCSFLESAGYALWKKYGVNFSKILRLIQSKILGMISNESISAKTRLEIFINEFFKKNPPSIMEPVGRSLLP